MTVNIPEFQEELLSRNIGFNEKCMPAEIEGTHFLEIWNRSDKSHLQPESTFTSPTRDGVWEKAYDKYHVNPEEPKYWDYVRINKETGAVHKQPSVYGTKTEVINKIMSYNRKYRYEMRYLIDYNENGYFLSLIV